MRPRTVQKTIDRMAAADGETDADGGTDAEFFVQSEKSSIAYPSEWAAFGEACWDDLTRPSECAKDDVRDRQPGPDGAHKTHRIHWINTRIDDMVDIVTGLGQEHFNTNDFHISKWKLLDLKKYYHRCAAATLFYCSLVFY